MVTAKTAADYYIYFYSTTLYSIEAGGEMVLEWGIYLILALLKLSFQGVLQPPHPLEDSKKKVIKSLQPNWGNTFMNEFFILFFIKRLNSN